MGDEGLPEELRELGRRLRVPDVDGETMAERVLAQLLAERVPPPAPPPRRFARLRDRWKRLLAVLSGVLVVLVLTPPVRAGVVDWLGFGGVDVRYEPGASPAPGAPVPGCPEGAAGVGLAEAGRRAGFVPGVPAALGAPDAAAVTGAPPRAVVGLCWRTGQGRTVRLDVFPGRLDLGFAKTVRTPPEWVALPGGTEAYWFARPHLLTFPMTDAAGGSWTPSTRTAGPTLLWTGSGGALTFRLEGITDRAEAIRIAGSVP
ncbi:hypothetical protein ACFY7C_30790 [Streptomyces sp. NPDC012769]|uniref:hypothetical protein n=1 Tax=Streptomyces sp. NPDC012769 TaxID=3364848 RepID=UPI0036D043E6